jgi:hypothetical protein
MPPSGGGPAHGYGQPDVVGSGYGTTEMPGVPPVPRRSRARWIAVGIGGVAVAALAAGVAFGVSALRGGGPQPEEYVPADAIGFVKVDLDPSAGQKIGAIRFLRKFPDVRDKFSEDRDLRESVFDLLVDSDAVKDLDYAKDIEPWLGDRVGVAVLPPETGGDNGSDPRVVVALQVKDEAKARTGIQRLADQGEGDPPGVVVRDGYAIIAEDQRQADTMSEAAAKSNLSDDAGFAADFDRIGDTGIHAGWIDLDAISQIAGDLGASSESEAAALEGLSGRLSYVVRFDGDDLDFVGDAVGLKGVPKITQTTARMGELPPTTVAAFGLAGGDSYVRDGWQRFLDAMQDADEGEDVQSTIDQFEEQYNLSLPDDIAVILGKSLTLSVDGENLSDEPQIGARVVTNGDRASELVQTLEKALRDQGSVAALSQVRTDDGIVVASTDAYADALAQGGGDLGRSEGFRSAVPDVNGANAAVYVDLDRIAELLGDEVGDQTTRQSLAAIDAIGMTAAVEDQGAVRYRIRVVTR